MIKFMWKDFEEADMMVEKIYEEERHIIAKLEDVRKKRKIAEEERDFIGNWLKRNGAPESVREEIDKVINPIIF